MKRLNRVAPLALAVLLSSAAATAEPDIELGAELYADFCAGCHGDDLAGVQNFSDDLARFTERLEGVTEDMPDFAGTFEPDEIAAMHAFLAAATQPEDAP